MSLRIRRGLESQRATRTFDLGELIYTTDTRKLYIGDGATTGGIDLLANMTGTVTSVNTKTGIVSLTTADISEGQSGPEYYTSTKALSAVGINLENAQHSALQFDWNSSAIIGTVLVDDVTIGIGEDNKLTVLGGGGGGTSLPADASGFLANDGEGNLSWESIDISGFITQLSEDTLPTLGGNLDLNEHEINGLGNININGTISNGSITLDGHALVGSIIVDPENADSKTLQIRPNAYGLASIDVLGISSGPNTSMHIDFSAQRGTVQSPAINNDGDSVGGFLFRARNILNPTPPFDGWSPVAAIGAVVTEVGDGITTPRGKLQFAVSLTPDPSDPALILAELRQDGSFTAPSILPGVYANGAARDTKITEPAAGMLVFLTDSQRFCGYFADTGLAQGLASNSTAGWVNLAPAVP